MDKAAKGNGADSKDAARAENLRLTDELSSLEGGYAEVQGVIQRLDREYEAAKSNPATRYTRMKAMVKDATEKEFMDALQAYVQKLKSGAQVSASGGGVSGGVARLLQKCKKLTGSPGDMSEREKALEGMTKQEILRDNEEKRRDVEKFRTRFLRAYNRLDKLRRDYDAAKCRKANKRYHALKEMIKAVTSDKML